MSGTGLDVSPDMTPEDVIAHYGKKGMRWGVTNDSDGGGSGGGTSSAKAKPSSDAVKVARENLQRQQLDIKSAKRDARMTTGKGSVERALANDKVKEMKVDLLNNPDRVTALYLTKGEKIWMGAVATAGIAVGGPGAVAGNAAGRALQRRSIEKKQRTGAYYK